MAARPGSAGRRRRPGVGGAGQAPLHPAHRRRADRRRRRAAHPGCRAAPPSPRPEAPPSRPAAPRRRSAKPSAQGAKPRAPRRPSPAPRRPSRRRRRRPRPRRHRGAKVTGTAAGSPASEPSTAPTTRRPHRPAPQVRSRPVAHRLPAERRAPQPTPARRLPRPRSPRWLRRPRPTGCALDPREKARRDAERPHLRIAEPPLDPTVHEAPGRTGLPLPDVGDALDAAVGMLRFGAEAAGVAPEDVERRVAQVLAYVRRRVDGDYEVDDFGYDRDFTENVFYPMLRPIYRRWFRVEVRGIENIPASGGALVVSNHSGTIAIDSLMVQLAIHDEHPQRRVMRALGADLVFQTPFLGTIARQVRLDAGRQRRRRAAASTRASWSASSPRASRASASRSASATSCSASAAAASWRRRCTRRCRSSRARSSAPRRSTRSSATSGTVARLLGLPVRADHADLPLARAARADPAAEQVDHRVRRARSPPTPTARGRPTTRCSSSTSPTRCARRSSRPSTRCSCSAARSSSDGGLSPAGAGHAHRASRLPPVRRRP